MANEDFTTYTEVDTGGFLSETPSKVTVTAMTSVTIAYLYKDFAADHFNAINEDFEIYIQNEEANKYGLMGIGFANSLHDYNLFGVAEVWMASQSRGSNVDWIRLVLGSFTESDYFVGSTATIYYCNLSRTAGSNIVTGKIYAEAAHTTLLDTIVISGLAGATKWRYAFGAGNFEDGTANRLSTGYIQNMNLHEPPPVPVTVVDGDLIGIAIIRKS